MNYHVVVLALASFCFIASATDDFHDGHLVLSLALEKYKSEIESDHKNWIRKFIQQNDFESLQIVTDLGQTGFRCSSTEYLIDAIGLTTNKKILNYLAIDLKCPMSTDTFTTAAKMGEMEILQLLHKWGCPWNEKTFRAAASNGNLDNMKWMHDMGCPWNSRTVKDAILQGSLANVK